MRIARVIQAETALPVVALERDGALYDVGELEERFGASPSIAVGVGDFFSRVIALGGVGLEALDQRLAGGHRPTEARLLPGAFVWLPPCDVERAMLVHVTARAGGDPSLRIGNARGLLGHEAAVPFPPEETRPAPELGIAAVLGEDLRRARAAEAERAIWGCAILDGWTAHDALEQGAPVARDRGAQLGPVLVTWGDLGPMERLRVQVRVDGQVAASATLAEAGLDLGEAVAFASRHLDLRAGDVIALTCPLNLPPVAYGARVDTLVERLGKLTGYPVRGPEPPPYRR